MTDSKRHFSTELIHSGEQRTPGGPAIPPIYQSTVFELEDDGSGRDPLRYPRLNNTPNHEIVGAKLAALDGGEAGLAMASGMAAISAAILHAVRDGGHILVQDCLYGGSHALVTQDVPAFGGAFDVIATRSGPDDWKKLLRPDTRAVYVEAMSNPLVSVIDHRAVVDFARAHDLVSMIDATFASPVNFRAAAFGYDVVLHSATKYLNGHSDLCAGALVTTAARMEAMGPLIIHMGGSLDALGCFLLHRGMRTLDMRVERQNATTAALAERLAAHPAVSAVHHPSLAAHPDHGRAREFFKGTGGVLAFEVAAGAEAATRWIEAVQLALHAPSLGGPETLVTRPVTSSHSFLSPDQRAAVGISDALIRVAVGFEHPDDIWADFDQAFDAIHR